MARPTKIDPRTTLAERLRAEASDSRPAFSEDLHARICDAVWQCRRVRASPPGRGFRGPVSLAGVAAAAALLLAAAVLLGPGRPPARPMAKVTGPAAASPASPTLPAGAENGFELVTDLTDRATEHFDNLVDAADAASPWTYPDHDAWLALESLGERLTIGLVPMPSSEPTGAAELSSGL